MTQPALRVVRGSRETDRQAVLRELYEKAGSSVYQRCLFLLKDQLAAEDAMQEVFAQALAHHSGFREEASPLTWLMRIATHHCLNLLRSQRAPWRERFVTERSGERAHGGPALFEMKDAVSKLLSRFDLETQQAVVHHYVDEMTLEEVAGVLGRSVPTIRKRLQQFARVCEREFVP